jgi:hypothetical protein
LAGNITQAEKHLAPSPKHQISLKLQTAKHQINFKFQAPNRRMLSGALEKAGHPTGAWTDKRHLLAVCGLEFEVYLMFGVLGLMLEPHYSALTLPYWSLLFL